MIKRITGHRYSKNLSKKFIDFAKTHPYEYMKISSQQYPHWGNEDNVFDRQKIKEIF